MAFFTDFWDFVEYSTGVEYQGGYLRTFPYEHFFLEVCIFSYKKDMKISNTAFDRSGSVVFSHVIFNVISA